MELSSNCRLRTEDCRLNNAKYNEISHYQAINNELSDSDLMNEVNKFRYVKVFPVFMLTLILLGISNGFSQGISDIYISGDFQNESLKEIINGIEKEHHIIFFYREEWISGISVTKSFRNTPVIKVFEEILKEDDFSVVSFNPNTVFLINEHAVALRAINDSLALAPGESEKYVDEKIFIGKTQNLAKGGNANLSGYIREAKTGEGIIGGTVYIEELKKGTASNQYGFYSITLPAGDYHISFSFIGLKKERKHIILHSSGTFNMELSEKYIRLHEVTITSEAEDVNITGVQMGKSSMNIKTIKTIPAFLGEVDVISSLMLFPAVSTVGEGAAGFNVRGGDVGQNLILLDDAPIFNSSHVFGFFSVFNPDAVKNVTLYSGGIPAKYGGRLSSILDVKQNEGNLKKFTGKGGIGMVSSRLTIGAPIVKDKCSFLIAGRTTYSDWILQEVPDFNVQNSSASFYDVTAKLNYTIDNQNKLFLSTYLSNDKFRFGPDTTYNWGTANAVLKYNHIFGEKLFSDFTAVYSDYHNKVYNQEQVNSFELEYGIEYKSLKADFTYFLQKHQLDFGAGTIRYGFQPGTLKPASEDSNINPVFIEEEQSREMAIYINDEYKISPGITLLYGLRYSLFKNLGPGNVYLYQDSIPKDPLSIIDTLQFSKGKVIKSYGGFEPRISVKFSLGPGSSVKLSYNRMRQYISLISNTVAITPLDIWKTSNKHIKPQTGDQIIIGYFKNFAKNSIETSIEAYYKKVNNLVEYKDGANLLLNETLEADLLEGKGRAYGLELQAKKKAGRLTGWASYVYSRSERKVNGEFDEEQINFGEYYPSNYDKPHNIKIVSNYRITRRWSFAVNFTYSTGRPFTAPYSKYRINSGILLHNITVANFSQRNQYRIPDYHRLDISVTLGE
ncbi:MAG: TonB-dependent receptor, partial [Bacteroidetes bacterium]|nr:TonB-dependent receptor [Bacteroidota bacterium]